MSCFSARFDADKGHLIRTRGLTMRLLRVAAPEILRPQAAESMSNPNCEHRRLKNNELKYNQRTVVYL